MFNFNNIMHSDALNKVIADLLENLEGTDESSQEYSTMTDNLVKLAKIRNDTIKLESDINIEATKLQTEIENDIEKRRTWWKPSPDAVVAAVGSVAGIVLILNYEKLGVVTSKAVGFVNKMK